MFFNQSEDSCLQPGKGKIEVVLVNHRPRQVNAMRRRLIALSGIVGELRNVWYAGVGKSKEPRDLVERFSHCIVARAPDVFVCAEFFHVYKFRVSARKNSAHTNTSG